MNLFKEYMDFLRQNKKWLLVPLAILMLLGVLLLLAQKTSVAPFIYSLL